MIASVRTSIRIDAPARWRSGAVLSTARALAGLFLNAANYKVTIIQSSQNAPTAIPASAIASSALIMPIVTRQ
jgi:hypothetical protein